MKEQVSTCKRCGKALYCLDGFFNGVITDDGSTWCFECNEKEERNQI